MSERAILAEYRAVRSSTEALCEPLEAEDFVVQSMPDASPGKWHLAHTTWFFETFVLTPNAHGYRPFDSRYAYLFNSYYESAGPRWRRDLRGLLSRPTVDEVRRYRAHVDRAMAEFLSGGVSSDAAERLILGLNHEQQHQELILTDLKHAWSCNPLVPVYRSPDRSTGGPPPHRSWASFAGGLLEIGNAGGGFAFDNERPRHRVFLRPFQLASRLVTCGDFLRFMDAGGYDTPTLWLSNGWVARQSHHWTSPMYWERSDDRWTQFTLSGSRPVEPDEPVCHVSFYEAEAFARWAGARLPTEAEWEVAAGAQPMAGHFAEAGRFHPSVGAAGDDAGPVYQLFGDVWQWTASPYVGYPGYRTPEGALGEYNGKFMCNQMVLRGASCATPRGHARPTYRNFFTPDARWQFAGVRLAKDVP